MSYVLNFSRQMLMSLSAGTSNSILAVGYVTDELTSCCVRAVVLPDIQFTSIFRHASTVLRFLRASFPSLTSIACSSPASAPQENRKASVTLRDVSLNTQSLSDTCLGKSG